MASFKSSLHFSDVAPCLVPTLERGNEKARTVKSVRNKVT